VNLGYKGATAFWENQKVQTFSWEQSQWLTGDWRLEVVVEIGINDDHP
jgi:hypothetical protein